MAEFVERELWDGEADAASGTVVNLEDLTDRTVASLLAKHLAPAAQEGGSYVRCLPMREARHFFSVREALAGARLFSAQKGENARIPVVTLTLETLSEMIQEAVREARDSRPSLVAALAPRDDLPPVSARRIRGGTFTPEPRFLARKRVFAE